MSTDARPDLGAQAQPVQRIVVHEQAEFAAPGHVLEAPEIVGFRIGPLEQDLANGADAEIAGVEDG